MLYCPECFGEYPETAMECPECRRELRPGAPALAAGGSADLEGSPEPKLVRLRSFHGPTAQVDADLARNILQTQGILSVLPGEVSAAVLPGVDVVQLLVRDEDAQQAAHILK